jgi:hypothetical protein
MCAGDVYQEDVMNFEVVTDRMNSQREIDLQVLPNHQIGKDFRWIQFQII